MNETKTLCMERDAAIGPSSVGRQIAAVPGVAQDRMPEVGQMHTDLIPTTGLEPHFDQRCVLPALAHPIMSDCQFALRRILNRVTIQIVVRG